MRRLREFFSSAHRPLQERLAILIAAAVAAAVAATGIAAYFLTLLTVYEQLDNELVDIANIMSDALSRDLENLGGIDASAAQAANVILVLVHSDRTIVTMPGRPTTVDVSHEEIAVARTSLGWSARSGVNSMGDPTRISSMEWFYRRRFGTFL